MFDNPISFGDKAKGEISALVILEYARCNNLALGHLVFNRCSFYFAGRV